jgi:hypothetical protein
MLNETDNFYCKMQAFHAAKDRLANPNAPLKDVLKEAGQIYRWASRVSKGGAEQPEVAAGQQEE